MKNWKISDLKSYALSKNIPIIQDDALNFIKNYIQNNNITSILEIGTAYGYSAVSFSSETTHVDTIERDRVRYEEALEWISLLDANVTLYAEDALTFDGLDSTYDLIFIDAAKSQYETLFKKYSALLNPGGSIICDNINFHNLKIETVKNRSTKGLLKKLEKFKTFLRENDTFETTFLDIGDGLTVSILK